MLVDEKFDVKGMRRVISTHTQLIERFNAAMSAQEYEEDFPEFYQQLMETVGNYAKKASNDLSYLHTSLKPEALRKHLTWYMNNIHK